MKKTEQAARQRILNRIARIEGQLGGIRRMLEQENQCIDVITQILAVRSAMTTLGIELLKEDLLCKDGKKRPVDEAHLKSLFTLK